MLQSINKEDEIIGVNNGTIHILSLSEQKTVKTINTNTKARCIIQLKNGQIILKNNDGKHFKKRRDIHYRGR
jgi:rRNA processing protein Krr1/Pno1